jgi:hypothetical protein
MVNIIMIIIIIIIQFFIIIIIIILHSFIGISLTAVACYRQETKHNKHEEIRNKNESK